MILTAIQIVMGVLFIIALLLIIISLIKDLKQLKELDRQIAEDDEIIRKLHEHVNCKCFNDLD